LFLGEAAGANSDGYVRTTVYLATVLFLVGISGHFRVRAARLGLIGIGGVISGDSLFGRHQGAARVAVADMAARLRDAFRSKQMRQLPLIEQAMGQQTLALLRQLDAACAAADDLEQAVTQSFNQHPDAGIITSFPGLGPLTGARVLAEIGDDRSRFADAKGLKAYAGAAPVTRASGKTRSVTVRRIKNNRLAAAGYLWSFSALTASPGARAHYDRRRDTGDRHAAAQRNLFGRLLGCLHHCLQTRQHYNEDIAFPATRDTTAKAAA